MGSCHVERFLHRILGRFKIETSCADDSVQGHGQIFITQQLVQMRLDSVFGSILRRSSLWGTG